MLRAFVMLLPLLALAVALPGAPSLGHDMEAAVHAVDSLATAARHGEVAEAAQSSSKGVDAQAQKEVKALYDQAVARLDVVAKQLGLPTKAAPAMKPAAAAPAAWLGQYNSTHGTKVPAKGDGTVTKSAWQCATQISLTNSFGKKQLGPTSCTSCKPGFTFALANHKSKAGSCRPQKIGNPADIICTAMDRDSGPVVDPGSDAMLCTKLNIMAVKVATPASSAFQTHKTVKMKDFQGKNGFAVAYCKLWKQSYCLNGKCGVKKEVTCLKICKLKDWPAVPDESTCSTAPCQGKLGGIICKQATMVA